MLIAVPVLLLLVFPYGVARLITSAGTRPMDQRLTSTPADFGLSFEDVAFRSEDGNVLKGWYLGGGERGVSIACGHGLFRSRREILDRASLLRRSGFNVLAFDFRRHGDSDGDRVSLGYHERRDVIAAIRYLEKKNPGDQLVAFGVSMGAVAALLAAAETPRIAAVVADSAFLSLEQTVLHHLDLIFGLPAFPLGYELMFFIERRADFDRRDFDLEKAVKKIGDRPLLFLAGGQDQRMPVEQQRRLYLGSQSARSRFEVIPGARHGAGYRVQPERYENVLLDFLASFQRGQGIE